MMVSRGIPEPHGPHDNKHVYWNRTFAHQTRRKHQRCIMPVATFLDQNEMACAIGDPCMHGTPTLRAVRPGTPCRPCCRQGQPGPSCTCWRQQQRHNNVTTTPTSSSRLRRSRIDVRSCCLRDTGQGRPGRDDRLTEDVEAACLRVVGKFEQGTM